MSWGIGDRVGVAVSAGTIATFNSRRPGPVPSLVLDFAGTGTLDSRITFTRSTTGTYYNSSGVLSTAAINASRFDYNPSTLAPLGLLIEQSSTNLLTYSQDFSNIAWNKFQCTVATGTNSAPDGTQTSNTLTATAGAGFHYAYRNIAVVISGSNTYSIYVKQGTATWIWFSVRDNSFNYFNVSTGAFGTTPDTCTVQNVGNGWYRITTTKTDILGVTAIGFASANGVNSFTATGTETVQIWGAQLEALAFATSYIPTTTAQVTRASDNASITGANFTSWYNQGQGTIYGEWISAPKLSQLANIYSDANNMMYFFAYSSGKSQITIKNAGNQTDTLYFYTQTPYTATKTAYSFTGTTNAVTANGGTPTTNTSAAQVPTVNTMAIGKFGTGAFDFMNGTIKKLVYYPTALTSAQLQALTT
jgi:hypothetical protein